MGLDPTPGDDSPPVEGWWKATDGNWYPPALRPASPAPEPLSSGNGLAVAALTLGIIGALFGVIPLTFFLAWTFGGFALVFGLIGQRRLTRKKMATWGAVLGSVSIGLGVAGLWIVMNVDELDEIFSLRDCGDLVDGEPVGAEFVDDFGDLDLSCELGDSITISIQIDCLRSDREIAFSDYGYAFTDDQIFHLGHAPTDC